MPGVPAGTEAAGRRPGRQEKVRGAAEGSADPVPGEAEAASRHREDPQGVCLRALEWKLRVACLQASACSKALDGAISIVVNHHQDNLEAASEVVAYEKPQPGPNVC